MCDISNVEELVKAIVALAGKSMSADDSDDALRFAQAAQHLSGSLYDLSEVD